MGAIIVTGAGRGIGKAIAMELIGAGHDVSLAARSEEQLAEVVREAERLPGRALACATDVTNAEDVASLVRQTEGAFGPIQAVVNNAGAFEAIGPTWEVDPESYWNDLTVNLKGPYLVCRAVIPAMVAQGYGTIINMIGGGSAGPIPYGNAYGTSKAGLTRFTETLAHELQPHGITVLATTPGLVRTTMTELQLNSAAGKRWMSRIGDAFEEGKDRPPTDAARLVRGLIEGDFFQLSGRRFTPDDIPEQVASDANRIVAEDLRTLRFRE